jgi:hypothetical protein
MTMSAHCLPPYKAGSLLYIKALKSPRIDDITGGDEDITLSDHHDVILRHLRMMICKVPARVELWLTGNSLAPMPMMFLTEIGREESGTTEVVRPRLSSLQVLGLTGYQKEEEKIII